MPGLTQKAGPGFRESGEGHYPYIVMATNTDWEALAKARGLEIPPGDLDRVIKPLQGLERRFRPLVQQLTSGPDPAITFRADPESHE